MTAFASQWTGRVFHTTLIGLILIDIVSFATLNTQAEVFLFVLLALAAIGVALFKPEWLLPIVFAELISTSNGHGLNIELFGISVGIRMVLFAIALAATCVRVMRSRESVWPSSLRLGGILLVILFVYATVSGFLRGYDVRDVYLDANGYFAIGYIWIASVWTTTALSRHALYEACAAAVMWVAMKTLLFVFAFGHLHPVTLDPLYRWIRDTRLGEITLQVGNVYRVFLQSQWFLVPSALVTTAYILFSEQRSVRETAPRIALILFASSLLISLSRSYWIGLIAGIVILAL
ncbi:hypothetical protein HYV72_02230 [Candidatus Uhrbacteria bacterium]|nr:hypothetical protein [Candidatus Uhrbacteria bacterium]